MKRVEQLSKIERWIWYGFIAIVVGLPFHAFLVTWISSFAPPSISMLLRYWKEIIFLGMAFGASILVVHDKAMRQRLLSDRFAWVLALFTLIHVIIYFVFGAAPFAAILGLKINIGFLILYLILSLTQIHRKVKTSTILKLILIPASIVGLIGVLQAFFLPHDILTHFGYSPFGSIINPAYYLIENSQTIRVMSTLWGPNQFGSYLVLPISLSLWWLLRGSGREQLFAGLVLLIDMVALYGSQSRGAWLAAAISIITIIVISARGWLRLVLATLGVGTISLIIILAASHKLPQKLSVLLLHGVPTANNTSNISSNEGHIRAISLGIDRLNSHPLGAGLEAAGRASENSTEKLYTENFFLQVAVQIGYQGLFVFLLICALIIWRLYSGISIELICLPLLASFIGLSINNVVAHTWSDGATAWLWWGIAGVVAAQTYRKQRDTNV